jgi:hypothetical protein
MSERRFLTTTQAAAWLREHYNMPAGAHTVRRAAKSGELVPHKRRDDGWDYFSRERLAEFAERRGFERVS